MPRRMVGVGHGGFDKNFPALPIGQDDFESYAVGAQVANVSMGNGVSWGGAASVDGVSDLVSRKGTKSLRFRWNGQRNSEQRFYHPQLTEYWLEFYVYFPDGTESDGLGGTLNRFVHPYTGTSNTNNKFIAFWADDYQGEPLGVFQLWAKETVLSNEDSRINVGLTYEESTDPASIDYPNSGDDPNWDGGELSFVTDAERGTWVQIRTHLRVSDFGQKNGAVQMWKNGALVVDVKNIGFQDPANTTNYLRNGYLMGWANELYAEDTSVFVDDFAFYDSDPGWV